MDRNSAVGLFLISTLVFVYFTFLAPKTPEKPQAVKSQPTVTTVGPVNGTPDSAAMAQQRAALGSFGNAAVGTAQNVDLENENLKVSFSTKGGSVNEVLLKNYKTFDKKPLILFDQKSSSTDVAFKTREGKEIRLSDLYFAPSAVTAISANETKGKQLAFRAEIGSGQYVEQVYTLIDGSFLLDYSLNFKGVEQLLANQPLTFTWKDRLKKTEFDLKQNRSHSSLNFMTVDESVTKMTGTSTEEEKIAGAGKMAG